MPIPILPSAVRSIPNLAPSASVQTLSRLQNFFHLCFSGVSKNHQNPSQLIDETKDFLNSQLVNISPEEVRVCLEDFRQHISIPLVNSQHTFSIDELKDLRQTASTLNKSSDVSVVLLSTAVISAIDHCEAQPHTIHSLPLLNPLIATFVQDDSFTAPNTEWLTELVQSSEDNLKHLAVKILIEKSDLTFDFTPHGVCNSDQLLTWGNIVLSALANHPQRANAHQAWILLVSETVESCTSESINSVKDLICLAIHQGRHNEVQKWSDALERIDGWSSSFGAEVSHTFCEASGVSDATIDSIVSIVRSHQQHFHRSLDIPQICQKVLNTPHSSALKHVLDLLNCFSITDIRLWNDLSRKVATSPRSEGQKTVGLELLKRPLDPLSPSTVTLKIKQMLRIAQNIGEDAAETFFTFCIDRSAGGDLSSQESVDLLFTFFEDTFFSLEAQPATSTTYSASCVLFGWKLFNLAVENGEHCDEAKEGASSRVLKLGTFLQSTSIWAEGSQINESNPPHYRVVRYIANTLLNDYERYRNTPIVNIIIRCLIKDGSFSSSLEKAYQIITTYSIIDGDIWKSLLLALEKHPNEPIYTKVHDAFIATPPAIPQPRLSECWTEVFNRTHTVDALLLMIESPYLTACAETQPNNRLYTSVIELFTRTLNRAKALPAKEQRRPGEKLREAKNVIANTLPKTGDNKVKKAQDALSELEPLYRELKLPKSMMTRINDLIASFDHKSKESKEDKTRKIDELLTATKTSTESSLEWYPALLKLLKECESRGFNPFKRVDAIEALVRVDHPEADEGALQQILFILRNPSCWKTPLKKGAKAPPAKGADIKKQVSTAYIIIFIRNAGRHLRCPLIEACKREDEFTNFFSAEQTTQLDMSEKRLKAFEELENLISRDDSKYSEIFKRLDTWCASKVFTPYSIFEKLYLSDRPLETGEELTSFSDITETLFKSLQADLTKHKNERKALTFEHISFVEMAKRLYMDLFRVFLHPQNNQKENAGIILQRMLSYFSEIDLFTTYELFTFHLALHLDVEYADTYAERLKDLYFKMVEKGIYTSEPSDLLHKAFCFWTSIQFDEVKKIEPITYISEAEELLSAVIQSLRASPVLNAYLKGETHVTNFERLQIALETARKHNAFVAIYTEFREHNQRLSSGEVTLDNFNLQTPDLFERLLEKFQPVWTSAIYYSKAIEEMLVLPILPNYDSLTDEIFERYDLQCISFLKRLFHFIDEECSKETSTEKALARTTMKKVLKSWESYCHFNHVTYEIVTLLLEQCIKPKVPLVKTFAALKDKPLEPPPQAITSNEVDQTALWYDAFITLERTIRCKLHKLCRGIIRLPAFVKITTCDYQKIFSLFQKIWEKYPEASKLLQNLLIPITSKMKIRGTQDETEAYNYLCLCRLKICVDLMQNAKPTDPANQDIKKLHMQRFQWCAFNWMLQDDFNASQTLVALFDCALQDDEPTADAPLEKSTPIPIHAQIDRAILSLKKAEHSLKSNETTLKKKFVPFTPPPSDSVELLVNKLHPIAARMVAFQDQMKTQMISMTEYEQAVDPVYRELMQMYNEISPLPGKSPTHLALAVVIVSVACKLSSNKCYQFEPDRETPATQEEIQAFNSRQIERLQAELKPQRHLLTQVVTADTIKMFDITKKTVWGK